MVGRSGWARRTGQLPSRRFALSRDALDIMQVVDGSTHRPAATDVASYYVYEKPVLAPADGVVDVRPGRTPRPADRSGRQLLPSGNHLVMDIGGGHFLDDRPPPREQHPGPVGDHVSEGQQIARVGNSGNTTAPHIHIQVQNRAERDRRHQNDRRYRDCCGTCTPTRCCSAMPR